MEQLKSLFAQPKRAAVAAACLLALLAALGVGAVYAVSAVAQSSSIGEEAALSAALADAGLPDGGAQSAGAEFTFQDGRFVYEVAFSAGNAQYRYVVNAATGAVVRKEKDLTAAPGATEPGGGLVPSKTLEEAREAALADAGAAPEEAAFTQEGLGQSGGLMVYQFQFRVGNTRYEYEINANTGAVYSKVREVYLDPVLSPAPDPSLPSAGGPSPAPTPEPSPSPVLASPLPSAQPAPEEPVTLEQAKAAALADAGVDAGQAVYTKTGIDYDGGVQVYEVEFYAGDCEYEYEINAATGAVHSRSAERFSHSGGHHGGASHIGVSKAKSICLEHAGFSSSDVVFTEAKLDEDDGLTVYEVEFRQNGMEYEYKIDAVTGEVLEYEHDWD